METIKETTRLLLQGTLTKDEADKILLDLLVVSGSFTAADMERAYDDGYSTEGEVTFDIENYLNKKPKFIRVSKEHCV